MARTILTGATVHRHDRPWEHGDDELLIEDGRIVATGKANEISSAARSDDEIIHLPGGRLLPGFFDAHLHLDIGGRLFANLQLVNKLTKSEVLESIRAQADDSKDWLVGIGLNENAWPSLAELDRVCPNRPLLLHTRDYHSARLNSTAINVIDLSRRSALPEGGWQELDDDGHPLGILRENAADWVTQYLPVEKPEKLRHHLRTAMNHLLSLGVTGVSDASHPTSYETGLKWLEQHEGLPIHVENWLRCVDFGPGFIQQPRLNRERLKRNRIKLF
ncbi:MAG TPA: hypothetical protein ENH10_03520, partial [Bacteroidetes bacterium]|nr:hypothetical protein [Bacteroidota bacterium]HEX04211.1 hypothetical protein [Bacteroidota bacterium]